MQPTQTLSRVNKQVEIVTGRRRVCKRTAYRLVEVYTRRQTVARENDDTTWSCRKFWYNFNVVQRKE